MTNYDPSVADGFVRLSRLRRAGRLCSLVWGLLGLWCRWVYQKKVLVINFRRYSVGEGIVI